MLETTEKQTQPTTTEQNKIEKNGDESNWSHKHQIESNSAYVESLPLPSPSIHTRQEDFFPRFRKNEKTETNTSFTNKGGRRTGGRVWSKKGKEQGSAPGPRRRR